MFEQLRTQLERFFVAHSYEIVAAAAFLIAVVTVAHWSSRVLRYVMAETFEVEQTIVLLTVRAFRFTLIFLAMVIVLDEMGVNVTSVIAAFGVIGLAAAFGLRTTMTNVFTGAMVGALKPYDVGDEIDAERIKGVVESTNLFHTVVVTDDGTYVSVPNGPIWAKSIKNKSRMRPMRLIFDVTADRTASYAVMRKTIEEVLLSDTSRYTAFKPLIKVEDVTDDGITLSASCWYQPETYMTARDKMELRLRHNLQDRGIDSVSVSARPLAVSKKPTKESGSESVSDDFI